jgi:hypothetical protein
MSAEQTYGIGAFNLMLGGLTATMLLLTAWTLATLLRLVYPDAVRGAWRRS